MKAAIRENAMSWNTENTISAIPAPSPSFPVMGAGINAATATRTRMRLMRIVARYWKAFAALTEVARGLPYSMFGAQKDGQKKGRSDTERSEIVLSPYAYNTCPAYHPELDRVSDVKAGAKY